MNKLKHLSNDRGLTLLELLLSMVLLFIVLVTFMGFFTQAALFQKINEDKFSVAQTSQKIVSLVDIKVDLDTLQSTYLNTNYQITGTQIYRITNKLDKNTSDAYSSDLSALLSTQVNSPYEITVDFNQYYQDANSTLIQATITVVDPSSKINNESITYTFIKG